MATFDGCYAEGNAWGGFFTNNPDSVFRNSKAVNNGSFGFLDASGPVLVQRLQLLLGQLENQLGQDADVVKQELHSLRTEIQKEKPDQSTVRTIWTTIKDKMTEKGGVLLAHGIWETASLIGEHIDKIPWDALVTML